MSTRKTHGSLAGTDEADSAARVGSPSKLLQKLLRKMPGSGGQQDDGGASKAPAGQRSGKGSDSVTPYLDEARNSRPGPLE